MARRSEHTREELTAMAVAAGGELIAENGLAGFSARAAAARMGYTVGTIYHLFGDLDTYILHINAVTLDDWHGEMLKALPKTGKSPSRRVRALAQGYLAYAGAHRNRWSALFEHHMPRGKIPDWYAPKMGRMFELVEEGALPFVGGDGKKAAKLARLLWAGVHGICLLSLTGKLEEIGADPPEKMIDDLLERFLGAE